MLLTSAFVVNENAFQQRHTVMNTPDTFEVVKINDTQIHVRHVLEKHFYTYGLGSDSNGKIMLSAQPIYVIEVADQETRADRLYDDARTFAEEKVLAEASRNSHATEPAEA
jgi:hypothetical protein